MFFIPYCKSPICFGYNHDSHQSVLKNTSKIYNKLLTRVGVMLNILGTSWYNIELVFYIGKTVKITNSVKIGKTGCVCVDECSLYIACFISIFMVT